MSDPSGYIEHYYLVVSLFDRLIAQNQLHCSKDIRFQSQLKA